MTPSQENRQSRSDRERSARSARRLRGGARQAASPMPADRPTRRLLRKQCTHIGSKMDIAGSGKLPAGITNQSDKDNQAGPSSQLE